MKELKSYTDIEQAKKLAEFLPLESADMRYTPFGDTHPWVWNEEVKLLEKDSVPCWSLAALLNVLKDDIKIEKTLFDQSDMFTYSILGDSFDYRTHEHENLIDACYEIIIKLHELNLL